MARRKNRRPRSVWDDFAPDDREPGEPNEDRRRESTWAGMNTDRPVQSNGCVRVRPLYEIEADT